MGANGATKHKGFREEYQNSFNLPQIQKLHHTVAKFIAQEMPFSLVEKLSSKKLVEVLHPQYKSLSSPSLTRENYPKFVSHYVLQLVALLFLMKEIMFMTNNVSVSSETLTQISHLYEGVSHYSNLLEIIKKRHSKRTKSIKLADRLGVKYF